MFRFMPFENKESNLFHYLDNMERNFFGDFGEFSQFRTDIVDKGDKYVLEAELPGFTKEEIRIDVNNNMLTICAQHKEEKEEKKENYVRRERKFGSFSRSFDVSEIDYEAIRAGYQNGVLSLELPKRTQALPPSRQIEIEDHCS